jgi:hypothetical protein
MGFETTTPVFERAKIFHALDLAHSMIGDQKKCGMQFVASLYPPRLSFSLMDVSLGVNSSR